MSSTFPADTPSNARRFLDIVHPEIAIFIKYEFWINLLSELRRRKVRSYIVSAIFRRNSVFFRPYGAMWRQALETFDTLFVQNVESKRLLSEIGFDNVVVAGDTRFDRVAQIAAAAAGGDDRTLSWRRSSFSWPDRRGGPTREILLPLVNANPDVKFVIAPHEMDEGYAHLMRNAKGGAVRYTQCDAATRFDDVQVLVLDTMGDALVGLRIGDLGLRRRRVRRRHPQYARSSDLRPADRLRPQLRQIQGGARHGIARLRCVGAHGRRTGGVVRAAVRRRGRRSVVPAARPGDYTARNQGATGIILRSIFNS